jgi:hypothetical protein
MKGLGPKGIRERIMASIGLLFVVNFALQFVVALLAPHLLLLIVVAVLVLVGKVVLRGRR